jgi:hypothetical protein
MNTLVPLPFDAMVGDTAVPSSDRFGPLIEVDRTTVNAAHLNMKPMAYFVPERPQSDITPFDIQTPVHTLARKPETDIDMAPWKWLRDYKVFRPKPLYYEQTLLGLGPQHKQATMFADACNPLSRLCDLVKTHDSAETRKTINIFVTNVCLHYYVIVRGWAYKCTKERAPPF